MSRLQLKIIASDAMLINHVGMMFFPGLFWIQVVGRIAFPIFAWWFTFNRKNFCEIY